MTPMPIRPNWELPLQQQVIANLIFGMLAVVTFIYANYLARKTKSNLPYFIFIGAALTTLYEPMNNVLGHCTYPEIKQITILTLFGRKIPTYIGFVYIFYFAFPILWLLQQLERGVTAGRWLIYYAVACMMAAAFEPVPIHFGWWMYYGAAQNPQFAGFPSWWWFVNPVPLFSVAAAIHCLRPHLNGANAAIAVVLVPVGTLISHGAASMPVFDALNADTASAGMTAYATVASALLAILLIFAGGWAATQAAVTAPETRLRRRLKVNQPT